MFFFTGLAVVLENHFRENKVDESFGPPSQLAHHPNGAGSTELGLIE